MENITSPPCVRRKYIKKKAAHRKSATRVVRGAKVRMWRDERWGTHCGMGGVSYLSHQVSWLPFSLLTLPPTHPHTLGEIVCDVCVCVCSTKSAERSKDVTTERVVVTFRGLLATCVTLYSVTTPDCIKWSQKHPYFMLQLELWCICSGRCGEEKSQ